MPLEDHHLSVEMLADPGGWSDADRRHVDTCPTCRATARTMGWMPSPKAEKVTLGGFALESQLGQGGMGSIWRASSVLTGIPVAIKVIRPDRVSGENRRLFEREIATVAGLDHRHIVSVLDVGEVLDGAASEALPVGSLWLAMEFLSGGSLQAYRVDGWRVLERVLSSTLLALAHAHSRGVVHRDLKPANLCIGASADTRPGLKLCDFGIAIASGQRVATAGTLPYMAPELHSNFRAGPWSDLYALGVVGWVLASRALPFTGDTDSANAAKRLGLPALQGVVDVPADYIEWLKWLAEPEPRQRPQSAQQALAALRALGPPVVQLAATTGRGAFSDTSVLTWNTLAVVETEPGPEAAMPVQGLGVAPESGVLLPPDWRGGTRRDPPLKLRGAGLGLVTLRDPDLVGHDAARDVLWGFARTPGAPVAVTGPSGVGVTATGRWLVRSVRARGGFGFTSDATSRRDALWRASVQLAGAHCEAPLPHATWVDLVLEEAVREWLGVLAQRCPTVVHLDAAGPGSEALAALCASVDAPVQVVWTVKRPPEGCGQVTLRPLPPEQVVEILTRHAGLEPASAVRLARLASGIPGTALAEMRSAIRAERAQWEAAGLVIDCVVGKPVQGWALRLDEHQLADLAVGAAIGIEVPAALWEPLCTSGLRWSAVRSLVRGGRAMLTSDGWTFLDPGIREWLLRRAGAGRADLHRAVLALLDGSYDGPDSDLWRARQLTALGHMDEAYASWKEAFWQRRQQRGCHALAALVFELQAEMDRLALPAEDPRRGMVRATLTQGWRIGSEREACLKEAASVLEDPNAHLWPVATGKVLLERARAMLHVDLEAAWADLEAAEQRVASATEDSEEVRLSLVDLAEHMLWLRYDRARLLGLRGHAEARVETLRRLCDEAAEASCHEIEADACCELAMDILTIDPHEAALWATRAREVNQLLGRMTGAADAWSVSGHVALTLGHMDRAREAFSTSIEIHERLNNAFGVFPCLGLVRVLLHCGEVEAAAERVRGALIDCRDLGGRVHGYALCLGAICDVRLGDLDAALAGFQSAIEVWGSDRMGVDEIHADLDAILRDPDARLLHPIMALLIAGEG